MCYDDFNIEDYLEDYEMFLRNLIDEIVERKIAETIKENKTIKKQLKKLKEEKDKLSKELYFIKKEHEEELKRAIENVAKETERKLSSGFAVGDYVWVVDHKAHRKKCPTCNGEKHSIVKVFDKDKKVDCPTCNGFGFIIKYEYFPKKVRIRSISFDIQSIEDRRYDKGSVVKYIKIWLEDYYTLEFSPDNLYKTKEECEKVCREKEEKHNNIK